MKDNFDLKKFLTENKTIEKSNPYLKEEMSDSEKEIIHDLIKGLGIFLFILGIVGVSDFNKRVRKK